MRTRIRAAAVEPLERRTLFSGATPTALAYYGPLLTYEDYSANQDHYDYAGQILFTAPKAPATDAGQVPAPTGTITLSLGGQVVGTEAVKSGLGSTVFSPGPSFGASFDFGYTAGTFAATATYSGDANYAPATLAGISVSLPQQHFAPGGEIGPTPALVLPSAVASTTTAAGLAPVVAGGTVPAVVAVGSTAAGTIRVTLDGVAAGVATVRVYAVPNGSTDPTAGTLLRTIRRRVAARATRPATVALAVRVPGTLTAGGYTLDAVATDAGGGSAVAAGPGLTVTPAVSALSLVVSAPASVAAGIAVPVTVTITNIGNEPAAGPLTVEADLFSTSAGDRTATVVRRAALRADGGKVVVRVGVRVPAGGWEPSAVVTGDPGGVASAVGSGGVAVG